MTPPSTCLTSLSASVLPGAPALRNIEGRPRRQARVSLFEMKELQIIQRFRSSGSLLPHHQPPWCSYPTIQTAICTPDSAGWRISGCFCGCTSSGARLRRRDQRQRRGFLLRWALCGSASQPSGHFGRRVPHACAGCHVDRAALAKPRQLPASLSVAVTGKHTQGGSRSIRPPRRGGACSGSPTAQPSAVTPALDGDTQHAADTAAADNRADSKANRALHQDNLPCKT